MTINLFQIKIERLVRQYGFKPEELKSTTLLEFALAAEQTSKDVGPFDPAFMHFKQQQLDFEAMAEYFEKMEKGEQSC